MSNTHNGERLKLWTPAIYRIEVEGEVAESWADRLGAMRITTRKRKDQTTVTTLIGRVTEAKRDQWWEHFIFGSMNRDQTLRFIGIHNGHHLRIMADIRAAAG